MNLGNIDCVVKKLTFVVLKFKQSLNEKSSSQFLLVSDLYVNNVSIHLYT